MNDYTVGRPTTEREFDYLLETAQLSHEMTKSYDDERFANIIARIIYARTMNQVCEVDEQRARDIVLTIESECKNLDVFN